jgi:hypothetical protein
MSADAHAEFEKQVLRVIAALYKSHPRTVALGWEITLVPRPHENDPDFKERIASSDGTLMWLYRSDSVVGDLTITASTYATISTHPAILNAQPSGRAYSILREDDTAIEDPTLGQAAVRAAAEPGSREESVVAELIVRRLSE